MRCLLIAGCLFDAFFCWATEWNLWPSCLKGGRSAGFEAMAIDETGGSEGFSLGDRIRRRAEGQLQLEMSQRSKKKTGGKKKKLESTDE